MKRLLEFLKEEVSKLDEISAELAQSAYLSAVQDRSVNMMDYRNYKSSKDNYLSTNAKKKFDKAKKRDMQSIKFSDYSKQKEDEELVHSFEMGEDNPFKISPLDFFKRHGKVPTGYRLDNKKVVKIIN